MPYFKRLNLPLWILAMCFFWVLSLYANGDADREFLKNSRAELKRLDEISQQKNNIEDPTATLNSGSDLTYVSPSRGGYSVSAIPQKTEEEKRAEEEEKKRLLEPGSELRLINRYVLTEEMTGIKMKLKRMKEMMIIQIQFQNIIH